MTITKGWMQAPKKERVRNSWILYGADLYQTEVVEKRVSKAVLFTTWRTRREVVLSQVKYPHDLAEIPTMPRRKS